MILMMRYSEQQITPEDEQAVLEALRSPYLTQGPLVERFEQALAEYVGSKYAVAVSSGTAALHIALLAAKGFANRDPHAVTSPLSFVASANAAVLAGYSIGFMDVSRDTGNMAYATLDADVLIPVHYAGRACAMPGFGGTPLPPTVIEDAAHAIGARGVDGSMVGSCAQSTMACFSFHPVKGMTTGEGGAVTCRDEGLAEELRMLRSHGRDSNGLMRLLGLNYRMDEMSAALGLSQLKRCDAMLARRLALAEMYTECLWPLSQSRVTLPVWQYGGAWHLYTIRIRNGRRDTVKAKLNAVGIQAQIHYKPIHEQPYYSADFSPLNFPEAHAWGEEVLSLPLHSGLTEKDIKRVAEVLAEAL